LVIVATIAWTAFFAIVMPLLQFPPLPGTEHVEAGARSRVVIWAVCLAGVAAGVASAVALWRWGRVSSAMSGRERVVSAALILTGLAAWSGFIALALSLEWTVYGPSEEYRRAAAPYAAISTVLLSGAWLAGLAVAARLLTEVRR
jgi:hypothetical protein